MFALFERLLKPTAISRGRRSRRRADRVLLAFRPPGETAVRRAVRRGILRRAARHDDADLPRPRRHARHRGDPKTLFAELRPMLLGMALVLLVLRPLAITAQNLLANQAIAANVSNRIRWQNHWHVVRQSWAFFQNDFAGRIANRVMQTGPAIRETVVALITGVWYILVYGTSALLLLGTAEPVARDADHAVVRRLSGAAAPVRAAHARPLEGDVGIALDAHRAHRRQLHQHPHRQAVRPRARGRRLCARGAGAAHRPLPSLAAAQHAVLASA